MKRPIQERITAKMVEAGAKSLARYDGNEWKALTPRDKEAYRGGVKVCLESALHPLVISDNWTDAEKDCEREKQQQEEKARGEREKAQREADRKRAEEYRAKREAEANENPAADAAPKKRKGLFK